MIDFYPSSTPLMILLPNNPAWPLTKSSQRPSSWARFSTKFIILGLLGLGSLTSTVKDPLNQDPTIGIVCGKNSCANENNNRTWWDQAPISLSQLGPSSKVISQTLSMAETKKKEGFGRGAWTPRKPVEATSAWVVTCPRNGTTNKPCNGR